jgi:hypothetical protein
VWRHSTIGLFGGTGEYGARETAVPGNVAAERADVFEPDKMTFIQSSPVFRTLVSKPERSKTRGHRKAVSTTDTGSGLRGTAQPEIQQLPDLENTGNLRG